MRRILRKYPKEIYEISEHFVVVTFMFNNVVSQNVSQNVSQKILTTRQKSILQYIQEDNSIPAIQIASNMNVNVRTIYRELKLMNIHWIGASKSGHWEIIQ